MKKQTAVEWYENEINVLIRKYENQEISKRDYSIMRHNLFYPAKAMEKEQTEENMAKAITFGWELSHHHRLNTEEKLLQMQKDFIISVIEGGDNV
jgi:hypothetical protein